MLPFQGKGRARRHVGDRRYRDMRRLTTEIRSEK